MRIDGPFLKIYQLNNWLIISLALLGSIISGLGVVYVKHKIRTLHMQLQNMYVVRSNLNSEWSKLLLEKSTWLSESRVESIAKMDLHMIYPEQIYIIRQ